ncbi:protein of unknown function [Cupriavidus taiwanensis]|nr:protein of unknown function [Cupriavidus taiwanensis]
MLVGCSHFRESLAFPHSKLVFVNQKFPDDIRSCRIEKVLRVLSNARGSGRQLSRSIAWSQRFHCCGIFKASLIDALVWKTVNSFTAGNHMCGCRQEERLTHPERT